ncbi:MAG TPA: 4-(cytidine 5'-diphospho)-2-C-methyl-D-erythritol kinase [Erysipelotrichaceae bacterium]|nr:4-(cytidine 5'-diphospho)-2-C-methyl-D-erythritol kinase [Erysipelotrichaceae bacterium]
MRTKAYAKINLFLDVVGKREDGYHLLDMVMVPIDTFDTLSIEPAENVVMECDRYYIPTDGRNTVIKAYELMRDRYSIKDSHAIRLVKNIPAQAGMAGGSADAAAMIRLLNDEYRLGLTVEQMMEIAISVGADVPFCVLNQSARVSGIGEVIEPFERKLNAYMILIKPKFGISTPALFKSFAFDNKTQTASIDSMIEALTTDNYPLFISSIYNRLQQEAVKQFPELQKMIDLLLSLGFDAAAMTGSGSVIYGVTQDENVVNQAVKALVYKFPYVKKTRML